MDLYHFWVSVYFELVIYNSIGKQVYNTSIHQMNSLELQLNFLAKGIYFIHIIDDNKSTNSRHVIPIVKQ